mmetsp:Transcript_62050/g.183317  ORF Transcript_62050/g.183317 Transcript_62050/m.183317 type:complete len:409 (+) Transcript_62050:1389-2615(+)
MGRSVPVVQRTEHITVVLAPRSSSPDHLPVHGAPRRFGFVPSSPRTRTEVHFGTIVGGAERCGTQRTPPRRGPFPGRSGHTVAPRTGSRRRGSDGTVPISHQSRERRRAADHLHPLLFLGGRSLVDHAVVHEFANLCAVGRRRDAQRGRRTAPSAQGRRQLGQTFELARPSRGGCELQSISTGAVPRRGSFGRGRGSVGVGIGVADAGGYAGIVREEGDGGVWSVAAAAAAVGWAVAVAVGAAGLALALALASVGDPLGTPSGLLGIPTTRRPSRDRGRISIPAGRAVRFALLQIGIQGGRSLRPPPRPIIPALGIGTVGMTPPRFLPLDEQQRQYSRHGGSHHGRCDDDGQVVPRVSREGGGLRYGGVDVRVTIAIVAVVAVVPRGDNCGVAGRRGGAGGGANGGRR